LPIASVLLVGRHVLDDALVEDRDRLLLGVGRFPVDLRDHLQPLRPDLHVAASRLAPPERRDVVRGMGEALQVLDLRGARKEAHLRDLGHLPEPAHVTGQRHELVGGPGRLHDPEGGDLGLVCGGQELRDHLALLDGRELGVVELDHFAEERPGRRLLGRRDRRRQDGQEEGPEHAA
jgi:hypothetical protein